MKVPILGKVMFPDLSGLTLHQWETMFVEISAILHIPLLCSARCSVTFYRPVKIDKSFGSAEDSLITTGTQWLKD